MYEKFPELNEDMSSHEKDPPVVQHNERMDEQMTTYHLPDMSPKCLSNCKRNDAKHLRKETNDLQEAEKISLVRISNIKCWRTVEKSTQGFWGKLFSFLNFVPRPNYPSNVVTQGNPTTLLMDIFLRTPGKWAVHQETKLRAVAPTQKTKAVPGLHLSCWLLEQAHPHLEEGSLQKVGLWERARPWIQPRLLTSHSLTLYTPPSSHAWTRSPEAS